METWIPYVCRRCRYVDTFEAEDLADALIPVHTCGRRMTPATDAEVDAFVSGRAKAKPAKAGRARA